MRADGLLARAVGGVFNVRPRFPTLLFIVAALAGLIFSGFSAADFVQHLDREVHSIHCSFIPGLTNTDGSGSSGCHTTLMSPYSSVLRTLVWGGLPIALFGVATFAFLLFRGVELAVNRRERDTGATLFLMLASLVPVATSIVYGSIAFFVLEAACKVCIGIYGSSFVLLGAAIAAHIASRRDTATPDGAVEGEADPEQIVDAPAPRWREHAIGLAELGGFVAATVLTYMLVVPDYGRYAGQCGALEKPEDPYGVMVPIGGTHGGKPAIEVFDPLCPACRALDERLAASGLGLKIDRKAVMFPLDQECNWMVGGTLHPGACTVSEAVLCAGDQADEVVNWAFQNQDAIREAAAKDPKAAKAMVDGRFPDLASCVGSAQSKTRLNRSLRWAVANKLSVLTPQLYVDGVKLCDEDTDLGLDYSLSRLLTLSTPVAQETP
jgi:uncharacterized membrane protein